MLLPITNIQRFSTHDGPGIRTTAFIKGCPLRCKWCHNPETQSCHPQIFYLSNSCIHCGACIKACWTGAHLIDKDNRHSFDVKLCTGCLKCTEVCPVKAVEPVSRWMTAEEIIHVVLMDRAFYGENGGFTLSGGEPLLYVESAIELLHMAKENGLSTAVETSGYFNDTYIKELVECTDLFLWDFKDGNPRRHFKNTGVSSKKILQNLFLTDTYDTKILLRCIMVKGGNMEENHLCAIANIVSKMNHCIGVELLPYHTYGGSKNEQLGYGDNGRKDWVPTLEDMHVAKERLRKLLPLRILLSCEY